MKRSSYASPYAIWMVMFTLVPLLFVVNAFKLRPVLDQCQEAARGQE